MKRKRRAKPCASGEAFWKDLVKQFGKSEAADVAGRYFDCPVREGDEEEKQFRRELREAMGEGSI